MARLQAEVDHAGGDGGVGIAVDEDERAGGAVVLVAVEGNRLGERQVGEADVVERQGLGGERLEAVDVDLMLELAHRGADGAGAGLEQIGAAGQQRLVGHPDEMGGDLIGTLRPVLGRGQDIAAADVDLDIGGHGDRIAGGDRVKVAVHGDQAGDPRRLAGARHDDRVARADGTGGDGAGIAAEAGIGPVDPLHRQTERRLGDAVGDLDLFEMGEQRRAAIPGRAGARLNDVVAVTGGQRDGDQRLEAERPGKLGEFIADLDEAFLVEIDEVDLVHRQHDMADAEQRDDVGVAAGLGEDAVLGVDEEDGEIGGRGAGRHVAGVLNVAGGIGDDEAAVLGGEIAVGDVDGDALLALGGQAIDDEGEVELLAGGAEAL